MNKMIEIKLHEIFNHYNEPVQIDNNSIYNLVTISNNGNISLRTKKRGSEIKAGKMYLIKKGQFIYSRLAAHTGSYGIVPPALDDAVVSNEMPSFNFVNSKILPEYFLYLSKLNTFCTKLKMLTQGMGRVRIKEEVFLEIPIIIHSLLQDQKACVESINKKSVIINSISNNFELQKSYLKLLRQSILKEAIEGKLTDVWRKKNPALISGENHASKLLEKIKSEKDRLVKEGKIKKERSLSPITDAEKPSDLSEGWVWCRIDNLVPSLYRDLRTGPFGSSLHKSDHRQCGVPVLGIESIGKNGVYMGVNKIYVDEGKAVSLSSFKVIAGDIIISRSGTVGELCLLPDEFEFGLISTNLMKISLNRKIVFPKFFCLLFKGAKSIEQQLFNLCSGTSRLFLTQSILSKLFFPLPSLAEQRAIVERVDKIMARIDELEKQVTERKDKSERLMQSVLREAFEGK